MAVISENMIKLLNFRIEQEEYSSRLYKAMGICMDYKGYSGAAKLFKKYSDEEAAHAEWAYSYLLDLDIRPTVPAIQAPPPEFEGLLQVIDKAYKHELMITKQCEELAKAALTEGSFMTLALAQKYLKEQVEELSKVIFWLDRIEVLGGSKITPDGLFLLDKEMGE
jgi:ferritin